MPASVDYLTLVIAGALLFWAGSSGDADGKIGRIEFVVSVGGTGLFTIGTIRALMSAFGL